MNRTFKRAAAVLLALACAAGAAVSAAAAAPEVDASKAVIDNAGILSAETEDIVTNLSSALSDTCGAQIGVYTIDQVGNTTMEAYAYDVFSAWGLGDDDRDNGVLLLLAPVDDDYWAMQGSGLETRLPSSTLSDLLYEYLEPSWVQQDYDTGTQAMVRALAEELCNIYGVSMDIDAVACGDFTSVGGEPAGREGGFPVVGIIVLILVLVVVLAVLLTPRFRGPGPGPGYYGRPRRTFFFFGPPRPSRPPRPPRPPRGPGGYGYGAPRPPRGGYGGPRPGGPRPGGARPGGGRSFRAGGGSTRGGGAGRRH